MSAIPNMRSPNACGRRSGDEIASDADGAMCCTILLLHHYVREARMKKRGANDGGGDSAWNTQFISKDGSVRDARLRSCVGGRWVGRRNQ